MKRDKCAIDAVFIAVLSSAQIKEQHLSHYIFEDFTPGLIFMKNGVVNRGALNYNSVTEEMLFKESGKILAIGKDEIERVDTVLIREKKFYPYRGKFLEIIYTKGEKELQVEHKCRVVEPPKTTIFGTTTETGSSRNYSSVLSNGVLYNLEIPEGYRIVPYKYYWFRDGKKMSKILNFRQLEKLFKDDKEKYDKYMKENRVNFNNDREVAALVKHMLE